MICSLGIEVESVIVDSLFRALLPLLGLCNSANIVMYPFFFILMLRHLRPSLKGESITIHFEPDLFVNLALTHRTSARI